MTSKWKLSLFGFASILISTSSFAGVSINVGLVLGGYHRDPVVQRVYVQHQSPYTEVTGEVGYVDEEPTILPYEAEDGCVEDCENSYVVVDHVLIGGVVYPYTSVVVLNRRGTKVLRVHPFNDVVVARRWNERVIAVQPARERVVVKSRWFGPKVRHQHAYVVHRSVKRR